MSNFFYYCARPDETGGIDATLGLAETAAQVLKNVKSSDRVRGSWGGGLAFGRATGDGTRFTRSEGGRSWLLPIGTWFHDSGLASGDEAALLARIDVDGIENVARQLEGFFVLLVGNDQGQIHLISDLAGGCHCYYKTLPEGMAWASSSAMLAAVWQTDLDPIATQEFIGTGIIFEDRSLWDGVRKLASATIATWDPASGFSQRKYWNFSSIVPQRLALKQGAEAVAASLTAVAKRIGNRFPRPLCDLTGGYDSRATIAGFLAAGVPVETTVSGPSDSPDVVVSTRIAAEFGLRHTVKSTPWKPSFDAFGGAFALTDGEYELNEYSRIAAIHREHAAAHDISVNGSFGELGRGYWWELLLPGLGANRPLDAFALSSKRLAAVPYDASIFSDGHRIDLRAHMAEVISRTNREMQGFPNTSQMDHIYFTLRMQRWQGRIGSSTNQIWPAVSPFAFRSLLIPVLETQWQARIRSLLIRTMLNQMNPKLANIPLEHGYPAIPAKPGNLFRFRSVPIHYAERALNKVRRKLGIRSGARPSISTESICSAFARDDMAMTLARFKELSGQKFIDPSRLARLAADSLLPGFYQETQWCRVLTIEYALRKVVEAQTAHRVNEVHTIQS